MVARLGDAPEMGAIINQAQGKPGVNNETSLGKRETFFRGVRGLIGGIQSKEGVSLTGRNIRAGLLTKVDGKIANLRKEKLEEKEAVQKPIGIRAKPGEIGFQQKPTGPLPVFVDPLPPAAPALQQPNGPLPVFIDPLPHAAPAALPQAQPQAQQPVDKPFKYAMRVLDREAYDNGFQLKAIRHIYKNAVKTGDVRLKEELEKKATDAVQNPYNKRFVPMNDSMGRHHLQLRHLGKGSNHEVHLAIIPKATEAEAVAVAIPKDAHNADDVPYLNRLRGCPNVIQVRERDPVTGRCYFELANGDLYKVLHDPKISNAGQLLEDLADGGVQMAERGVVHLDLKPDNVLVGVDGRLKFADFEIAAFVNDQGKAIGNFGEGNLWYRSPERFEHGLGRSHNVGLQDNVWGEMLMMGDIARRAKDSQYQLSPEFARRFDWYIQLNSDALKEADKAGSQFSPKYMKRYQEVMLQGLNRHPNKNLFGGLTPDPKKPMDALMLRMGEVDPNRRINISQVREHLACIKDKKPAPKSFSAAPAF